MPYPTARTLLHVADEYAKALGLARGTISLRLFNDGTKLDKIDTVGADVGLTTFHRAMQYMSDNWPVDKAWPQGIERPSPSPREPDAVPSAPRRDGHGVDNDGGTE